MAPQSLSVQPSVSQISKNGVLVLWGFGIKCRIEQQHFVASWGCGLDRYQIRFSRIEGRKLRRVVCISTDGYLTLDVLSWLSGIGASFICLDRRGHVEFVTSPTSPTDSKIHRAQAIAVNTSVGLEICRTLIDAKLRGQEQVIRERLNDPATADAIATFRDRLLKADNFETLRTLEAHAAVKYFQRIATVDVLWSKTDLRKIPASWRSVGSRQSVLSGGPRSAVSPFHATLNYCTALLESATRIAISAVGLLPNLGLGLHTDTPQRDSAVFDICEPVRPQLEDWLLSWVMTEKLSRKDYFETETGQVRLTTHLCRRLSEIIPTLEKLVGPWVEHVQRALWQSTSQSKSSWRLIPATPLTQQHRREAKGQPSFPRIEPLPRPEAHCDNCGALIKRDRTHCGKCGRKITIKNFNKGRKAAQRPDSIAKRSATMQAHKAAIDNWTASDGEPGIDRDAYLNRIVPALAHVTLSRIRSALGVSEPYARWIKTGKRVPHVRHFPALAKLAGLID